MPKQVSLIISTIGRTAEFNRLLESINAQTYPVAEVIVVDQSAGDGLKHGAPEDRWSFPIRFLRTPNEKGVSRGRNAGWRAASGDLILFPDDDCWYPPHFIQHCLDVFERTDADIVSGRAADPKSGRSINGRFETEPQFVSRSNIWTTQIEWVVMFKRAVLEAVDGFNDDIGVGANSPWQACEGQDIMLRCLEAGFRAYFDPQNFAHHAELETDDPDRAMRIKGRKYARGHGFVLRTHGFGPQHALYWASRPLAKAALSTIRARRRAAAYYFGVAFGRLEGYAKIAR